MDEINQIANAPDDAAKKTAYEALIQNYLSRPAFAKQMFYFWRDTFKMGGTAMTRHRAGARRAAVGRERRRT